MIQHYPLLVYLYDGSYQGLLSCVFESFLHKELPTAIVAEQETQLSLMPARLISTTPEYAKRVANSLHHRLGAAVSEFFQLAFLTCLPDKELTMVQFLHLAFEQGPGVLQLLTNQTVHTLSRAILHLNNETHLLKGFIRFSDYHRFLVTTIHPKNYVLPLLAPHFCDRFAGESFLIYDENHNMALFHRPTHTEIIPLEELMLEAPDPEEQKYRALWQAYYQSIAIKARYNPKCRMSHMPKRYWSDMTEFAQTNMTPEMP